MESRRYVAESTTHVAQLRRARLAGAPVIVVSHDAVDLTESKLPDDLPLRTRQIARWAGSRDRSLGHAAGVLLPESGKWQVEDGTAITDGLLQYPPGEIWSHHFSDFSGYLELRSASDSSGTIEVFVKQGVAVATSARDMTLVGLRLCEVGLGTNSSVSPAASASFAEKGLGSLHVAFGVNSATHDLPLSVHRDFQVIGASGAS